MLVLKLLLLISVTLYPCVFAQDAVMKNPMWIEEFAVKKNQHLGNVKIGKQYRVTFDVLFEKLGAFAALGSGKGYWKTLLHLTATGGDLDAAGDRIPAIWVNGNKNFHVGTSINGEPQQDWDTKTPIEDKKWSSMEMTQWLVNGKVIP